jgi:hypothetical protein
MLILATVNSDSSSDFREFRIDYRVVKPKIIIANMQSSVLVEGFY